MLLDEVPEVAERFKALAKGDFSTQDHRGFLLRSDAIANRILVPKYYDPEVKAQLEELTKTHTPVSIGSLVDRGALSVDPGIEIKKMAYGRSYSACADLRLLELGDQGGLQARNQRGDP